jgi:hypothetical protein
MKLRIRWKAVPVAAGVLVGVLADPEAVGAISKALPSKAAHWLLAASAIAAVFFPAAVTKHPPREPDDTAEKPPRRLNQFRDPDGPGV